MDERNPLYVKPEEALLEHAANVGLVPRSQPPAREIPFVGDYRAEIARYVFEQRLGVRAEFPHIDPGEELVRQLVKVELPPWLASDWTITLGPAKHRWLTVEQETQLVPPDLYGLYAAVRFGTAAALHTVYVDWRQGCRFSLPAASVEVEARLPPAALPGAPFGFPLSISAQCIPGSVPKALPITRSVDYGTLEGQGNLNLPVPSFAYRMKVVFTVLDPSAANWIVDWTSANGATLRQRLNYAPLASRHLADATQWAEVPRNATGMRIFNNTPDRTMTYVTAIYELSI